MPAPSVGRHQQCDVYRSYYVVELLFQIPTTLPSPLTLLIILYPQKATSTATEIFLSEQLQIQKPKKNVYTRDIPLPFSHRSRPSCPPKKFASLFGFHKYTGWSFLFSHLCQSTYFRKADAERCFYIIHIIIWILFLVILKLELFSENNWRLVTDWTFPLILPNVYK